MAIYILTGCDRQQKQEFIHKQQTKLDPNWVAMNVHLYGTEELQQAVFCANTPALSQSLEQTNNSIESSIPGIFIKFFLNQLRNK